jgi:uncharacterized protein (TIGR02145 family)
MTTAERDAIVSPVIGLEIFNTTTDCKEIYNLSGWWNLCISHSPPTGVTATPSSPAVCIGSTLTLTGTASGGTMWKWTGPNGFTSALQNPSIITITTAAAGVYTLIASNAAGQAAAVSTPWITISSVPPGSAGSITGSTPIIPGQNGVAYSIASVTGATRYTWNYSGNGFTIASGTYTQSITANFSGSVTAGNLTVTPANGCGNGATSPAYPISIVFPMCGTTFTYGTVTANGKTWLDRNLGASRIATSSTDYLAYGVAYQWGRQSDEHQCISWINSYAGTPQNGTTLTQCPNGTCPNALFVQRNTNPEDWSNPFINNLWDASGGINNPCPAGYRVPTQDELTSLNTWVTSNYGGNSAGFFASPLKMPVAGFRNCRNGIITDAGNNGFYWSSTGGGTGSALALGFFTYTYSSRVTYGSSADGNSIRCIAN